MVVEIVVGTVEYVQGRESCLFPKLDLPLFKGLLLFIHHQSEARVGGWVGFFDITSLLHY